jgi:hypothetical protein
MRFLYKIHSGHDGFRPAVLPERMRNGRLRLGWRHYIDTVEKGWECWIYFHGPHRFTDGVYVKGIVDRVDLGANVVSLRVREHSTEQPITLQEISRRVAEVVAPRYRQVFVWPDEWTIAPECGLAACRNRQCDDCTQWSRLPLIRKGHAKAPLRLRWSKYQATVPAHWIVPSRCYATDIAPAVWEVTSRFTDFKLGEMAYAYPFARSMFERLRLRGLLSFDYVVPIPLSPAKAKKKERHRTRALADELGRLLVVPMREMLRLCESVSKRQMLSQGCTIAEFEDEYSNALRADVPANTTRILLVDDVLTRGSTVAQAIDAIRAQRPKVKVVVATAGQMIVKEVVVDDSGFRSAEPTPIF